MTWASRAENTERKGIGKGKAKEKGAGINGLFMASESVDLTLHGSGEPHYTSQTQLGQPWGYVGMLEPSERPF